MDVADEWVKAGVCREMLQVCLINESTAFTRVLGRLNPRREDYFDGCDYRGQWEEWKQEDANEMLRVRQNKTKKGCVKNICMSEETRKQKV